MMVGMTKKKPENIEPEPEPKKRPPSRENYKYFYIPKKLAEEIEAIAGEEDRSGSYIVKKACEAFVAKRKAAKRKE